MTPGVHDDISNEDYHSSPGISKSGLSAFARSPARFRFGEPIRTRSMALGTLVHTAVLEPEELEHRYAVSDLRTFNDQHKAYQEEVRRALGRELVKRADYDTARRTRDAVLSNPIARELITPDLIVERSFAWHDPATGVLCRGRADGIHPGFRVMLDLKSTKDARPESFGRDALNYRYHWQHPMYSDGMQIADGWTPEAFVFLCIEPERPHLTAAYELEPRAVELGRSDLAHWLPRYAESLRQDDWPGLHTGIETLALPPFAYR